MDTGLELMKIFESMRPLMKESFLKDPLAASAVNYRVGWIQGYLEHEVRNGASSDMAKNAILSLLALLDKANP